MNQSGNSTIKRQVFIAVSFGMRADAALICFSTSQSRQSYMLMEGSPY